MKKIYLFLGILLMAVSAYADTYSYNLVKEIRSGTGASIPANFVEYNGKLYFSATDGTTGIELWQSDGTTNGTSLVQDFNAGTANFSPINFTNFGNQLFFSGATSTYGTELYKYNTTDGISLHYDIRTGTANSAPGAFTQFNNKLYFKATAPNGKVLLYVMNDASSVPVAVDSTHFIGTTMTNFGNKILMSASTDGVSTQLYSFDGSNISLVKTIRDTGLGIPNTQFYKSQSQNLMYFVGRTDTTGYEPWVTDGTTEGTRQLKDIMSYGTSPGTTNSLSSYFIEYNGKVYFSATDADHGSELWVSDGTTAGTKMLLDINPGSTGSNPAYLTLFNDSIFFVATDATAGREIFVSDGTAEHTHLVGDFYPGSTGLSITEMFVYNNELYTNGSVSSAIGRELYKLTVTKETSGIGNVSKSSSLKVYSSNGKLIVNGEYNTYKIYDYSGRLVRKGTINNKEIDSSLASGYYIIKVDGGSGVASTSFIVK